MIISKGIDVDCLFEPQVPLSGEELNIELLIFVGVVVIDILIVKWHYGKKEEAVLLLCFAILLSIYF
ncbi:hypothetical protein DW182_00380 [Bacteroides sp. AM16-24]|nr:hypothetical protein DW182_00380 [Bacteroides sp. AM16-24]